MKNLIENDEAISVVVGAILILAVLVTFMSVVTSSWVPIYEGDAEAAHSDDTNEVFMGIHKQIELADEFSNSATVDLGTDEMAFIKGSNSVGYLEVNENSSGLFLTGNISRTDIPSTSDVGIGIDVEDLNTSSTNPLAVFRFEFEQLNPDGNSGNKLDSDFIVQFRTSTLNRWITLYKTPASSNTELGILLRYGGASQVKWINDDVRVSSPPSVPDSEIYMSDNKLHVNLLSNSTNLTLVEGPDQTINDIVYNVTNNYEATLHDVIQYCMGLPDGGSDYYIDYVQYNGVLDSVQYFELNSPIFSGTSTVGYDSIAQFNNTKIGGGTLSLRLDYNFMVDQSYVYDSGAVFLTQEDGSVLKVNPPIVATNNNNGNLSLSINSVILKGDYQASGNGVETLYTEPGGITTVSGFTDKITIVKETIPEYYGFWKSYFEELDSYASSFVTTNTNATYNETNSRLELMISDSASGITVSLQTKEITIT